MMKKIGGIRFILLCALAAATTTLKTLVFVCATNNSLTMEKSNYCGGEFTGYRYTIDSPNYPENYPENRNCVYILRGLPQCRGDRLSFHLQFIDFVLPPSENCQEDYLEIGERSLFCGLADSGIRTYNAKNNTLTVRFHSGAARRSGERKRFKILVTTSPCNSKIAKQNNTATSGPASIEMMRKKILLEAQSSSSSYPFYQPEIDFIDSKNNRDDKNRNDNDVESKVSMATPATPVKQLRDTVLPKISAYLFVPPSSESNSQNIAKIIANNEIRDRDSLVIDPPPREFLLPTAEWTTTLLFRDNSSSTVNNNNNTPGNVEIIDSRERQSFSSVPARSYGVVAHSYVNPSEIAYIPPPAYSGIAPLYPETSRYSQCCSNEYSEERFFLASRGFPSLFNSGNSYECVYSIRPYSSNICQIRFNFLYFNHGSEDTFCTNGYVDIDGRRICGCKRALVVLSRVTTIFPKTIAVRYSGYPSTKFHGFLIQVIQEPCNNNYYPYFSSRSKKDVGNATRETLKSNDISKIRAKRNLGYSYPEPSIRLNHEPAISLPWNSAKGANIFAPVSSCQTLSFFDWVNAAKVVYLRGARCTRNGLSTGKRPLPGGYPGGGGGWLPGQYPGYPPSTGTIIPGYPDNGGWWNIPSSKCENVNVVQGLIASPLYPANYPNNIDKCYRFYKAPTSCQLEVTFLDFDLENSSGCFKDYVAFGPQNRRYCGRSLAGSSSLIDISRTNIFDMHFVSDGYGTGRGFSVGFSQISCNNQIAR